MWALVQLWLVCVNDHRNIKWHLPAGTVPPYLLCVSHIHCDSSKQGHENRHSRGTQTFKTEVDNLATLHQICGAVSVVGIATGYGLDGPGIEWWAG